MVNDLFVHGESPEIDKLVERIEKDTRDGWWRREPSVAQSLRRSGRGRLGLFCYSWRGSEKLPAASLLIYRTAPGELASSSMMPSGRKSLETVEINGILENFVDDVLRPLAEGLDIKLTVQPPRGSRLEWSLSPDAFRKLNRFLSMLSNAADLTSEDRARWGDFWSQTYMDGSALDDRDLGSWLMQQGLSEPEASALIANKDVGMWMVHDELGI